MYVYETSKKKVSWWEGEWLLRNAKVLEWLLLHRAMSIAQGQLPGLWKVHHEPLKFILQLLLSDQSERAPGSSDSHELCERLENEKIVADSVVQAHKFRLVCAWIFKFF